MMLIPVRPRILKYLPVIALLLLLAAHHRAQAKAMPFEQILRKPETQQRPVIVLDSATLAELPKKSDTTTWPYAEKPLFMEKSRQNKTPKAALSSPFSPRDVYNWTEQEPSLQNSAAEDARMVIEDGRVTDFSPGKKGLRTDLRATTVTLLKDLALGNSATTIQGFHTDPAHDLAQTNRLGIKEFISGGVSDFTGSSRNRLANIDAGLRQLRGTLIEPGQVFSFGEALGDITAANGFKPEIVIKADGLKPELGGGICQVSSTLFRAVMQSGMPITQRKNHAFSVSHYLPAGTDATIYTPVTDLKFINDTPAHILIWPYYASKTTLVFDLYGSRDGRNVVVDEPVQWDKQANGALKASWSRHVSKNGNMRDDTFKSNYLPPALFKKEEQFVTASPTVTEVVPTPIPTPTATPSTIPTPIH